MTTQVKIPNEVMPSVIGMLTDKMEQIQNHLTTMERNYESAQYRISELKNQVDALKAENKRLYGMIEHADDRIETDCEDF